MLEYILFTILTQGKNRVPLQQTVEEQKDKEC